MFPFTLYQLRVLKALAMEKNFTKAAKNLYLSQPSLSKQIKLLEKSLGVSVINREGKTNVLTKKGDLLLRYAERILALCEESCRTLIDSKKGERGNLIIGVNQSIGIYLFPKIVAFFAQTHPQITLNIRVYSTLELINKLQLRTIDFAISNDAIFPNKRSEFSFKPFLYDKITLLLPESNRLDTVQKPCLHASPYITLRIGSEQNSDIEKILKKNRIKTNQLNKILQFDSIEEVKTAVHLGLGIAFVPTLSITKEINTKKFKLFRMKRFQGTEKIYIVQNLLQSESKISKTFYTALLSVTN